MASVFSRRVVSYILDFFVVSAFMWIVSYFLYFILSPAGVYSIYQLFIYVVPILGFVYFVLCEKMAGSTVGKSLMFLQVKSRNGADISWMQAIVRNLTKIYWVPIIFDWLIGRILNTDRVFNNITRTVVVEEY